MQTILVTVCYHQALTGDVGYQSGCMGVRVLMRQTSFRLLSGWSKKQQMSYESVKSHRRVVSWARL